MSDLNRESLLATVDSPDSTEPELDGYGQVIDELSEEQYLAASAMNLSSLVLAGAGTGKTRTLIGRLAYLYSQGHFQHSTVLMMAFATKAATEMRERIDHLLPMLREAVQVNTFHSLGLQIVSKVTGVQPKLTELSQSEALSRFIRQGFFEFCAKDKVYLDGYFRWINFSTMNHSAAHSLRSLNDEYVHNHVELICANLLYQLDIDYFYRPLYAYQHKWVKYQSYQPGFYLASQGLYLEVYEVAERALDEAQRCRRQKYLSIHAQHGTEVLELFVEGSLSCFYEEAQRKLSQRQTTVRASLARRQSLRLGRSAYHYEQLVEQLSQWLPLFKHELHWPDLEQILPADGALLNALLEPLWRRYQDHLKQSGTIDFEQMIVLATEHVRSGAFKVPWREIMIDEFQDISAHRAALIQVMRQQCPELRLFCVGDDWQAIYRFAGSDLRFTTEFERFFGEVQRYTLSQTFRFGEVLSRESSRFVLQNHHQSRKILYGQQGHQNPLVLCPLEQMPQKSWMHSVLAQIQKDGFTSYQLSQEAPETQQQRRSVLILSRFHHFLPSLREMQVWAECFPWLELLQGTVHGVKGNEADYVLLLEVNRGEFGFPSEKTSDQLIENCLPMAEDFLFAEERRLFYVALTRARQQVYLVYSEDEASVFIEELKKDYPLMYLSELIQSANLGSKPKRISWSGLNIFKFR
ncbi:MAG: UvrD-helicase domain-containing protein [Alcaligenaceae bacterium]|nr:UvrD-helicase domain-containing protein [Alcaligenaceae bacterium]